MKKYLLSGLFVLAFVIYAGYQYFHPANTASDLASSASSSPNSISDSNSNFRVNSNSNQAAVGFRDGSYTGSAVDAFYGIVQVRATISGGKLTAVEFLQYPNDRGHSSEVSAMAIPRLRSEAISAQSANVDVVSGATQTSEAFIQSLQSALAQA